MKRDNPLAIGLSSVRALVVPMIVLWTVATAMVFSYYAIPDVAAALEPLSRWQSDSGLSAAFLNRVVFCGVIPGAFLVTVRTLRPRHPFLTVLLQSVWCGLWGIAVAMFYQLLDLTIGGGVDWKRLVAKTAADELILTPFLISPADAVFFFWLGRDLSFKRVRCEWPANFAGRLLAPNLLANWCVWIPTSFAIFAFPLPLQIQISGILSSMWALMSLQIGIRSVRNGNKG